MKQLRWIALLLLMTLTLSLFCGCKSTDEDDFTAEVGDLFEEETDQKDPEKEEEKTPAEQEKEEEEKTPAEQEKEEEKAPAEQEKEEEKTPAEQEKEEPDQKEPQTDLSALKADKSGTAITFIMQNLRTTGNRPGTLGESWDGPELNQAYYRIRRFRKMVQTHDADVICCQEGTKAWINFFQSDPYFTANYAMVQKYIDPDAVVITSNPILYKKTKYDLLDSGHYYLSETPDVVSDSYEAGQGHVRMMTWAKLRDKASGEEFYVNSAHIDTGGVTPIKSMMQVYDQFDQMGKDAYAFVGGDYNMHYNSAEYQSAIDWEEIMCFQDVALNLADDGLCTLGGVDGSLTGKVDSTTAYDTATVPDPNPGRDGAQLDYLMAKHNPHMTVDYYGFDYTLYDLPEEGIPSAYISDHYGLVVKVRIGTNQDYSQYHVEH